MGENEFWRVCEALDNEKRMALLRYLLADRKEFPCVIEIAEKFDLGLAATSAYLKKMLDVGLVASKREERRIYYRAYATTPEGERVVAALQAFFETNPPRERMLSLMGYVRALSHYRRHAVIRLLNDMPGLDMEEIGHRLDMPRTTVDRILAQLGKTRIVDLNRIVRRPEAQPEATFLDLTLS